ncbi:MAG: cytidine deaminase [Clostridiaceae bacterium]|jgi:cytidine deaminase|nr:cytidine deaminase [Clostridiaceae bacterium]
MKEADQKSESLDALAARALAARETAYAPYSRYPVGAAILTADGQVFDGCNVENLSFGATICAERAAAVKAVGAGAKRFTAMAVVSRDSTPCLPCGICRQFLSEFADPDFQVAACRADGTYVVYRFDALFPHAFSSDAIEREPDSTRIRTTEAET